MSNHPTAPSPALIFDTINAYQRSAALKAAIELDVFTAVGKGKETAQTLSNKCRTSERGMRILCDDMVVIGLLTKEGEHYGLTLDTAMFLDRGSPGYMGTAIDFLLSPMLTEGFKDVAAAVRKGGTVLPEHGTLAPEHPVWVKFARAMAPMMSLPAKLLAELVDKEANQPLRVLDIAAGHGLFGIAFGLRNPKAEIVAVDWLNVLEVAKENAGKALGERYRTIPGSALDVDYGSGYDLAFLTNFLHHFDVETCERLLRKIHAALAKGGRVAILEFIPNEDRVSPPGPAAFSLIMLGTTPAGDAYPFSELQRMCRNAGFSRSEFHPLPPTIQQVVIAHR
jgi:SAM-dependent methyltransferase